MHSLRATFSTPESCRSDQKSRETRSWRCGTHTEIFQSVEEFYRRFYFRTPEVAAIVSEMVRSPQLMMRRLREVVEFFAFLRERRELAH